MNKDWKKIIARKTAELTHNRYNTYYLEKAPLRLRTDVIAITYPKNKHFTSMQTIRRSL
jgi:hypothetical protein